MANDPKENSTGSDGTDGTPPTTSTAPTVPASTGPQPSWLREVPMPDLAQQRTDSKDPPGGND